MSRTAIIGDSRHHNKNTCILKRCFFENTGNGIMILCLPLKFRLSFLRSQRQTQHVAPVQYSAHIKKNEMQRFKYKQYCSTLKYIRYFYNNVFGSTAPCPPPPNILTSMCSVNAVLLVLLIKLTTPVQLLQQSIEKWTFVLFSFYS